MNKLLPERPDLGQLKKQAKELLDEVQAGRAEALARAGLKIEAREVIADFALADAQRVVAREYGFASWARLKLHVETRAEDSAEARLIEAALEGEREIVDLILRERPGLAGRSVFARAVFGGGPPFDAELARDPAAATRAGGPRGWVPLLYVCFGKCGADDAVRADAARRLLAAGADPNASWIHPDWPGAPLPALYGATGVNDYPAVARVLLEAGAEPNDSESRYHAAEHHHVRSLEVLREFGADFSRADGMWSTTPLCFLLGGVGVTPSVRKGIRWLLEHGANPNVRTFVSTYNQTALHAAIANDWDAEIVGALLDHGADPNLARGDGRTAFALAVRAGREDLQALLAGRGATAVAEPRDRFLGYAGRGDIAGAQRVLAEHPDLRAALSPEDRRLPLLLAKRGKAEALAALGGLGFDLTVTGGDGEQALHWAAWHGYAAAVRVLIECGVPVEVRDRRFHAPPLGWCGHGSLHRRNPAGDYGAVAELLLAAGAAADGTVGSAAVMAAIRRSREPR